MKKVTITTDEIKEMFSVLDVDLSEITAFDILKLVERTPLTRDLILDIAEEQNRLKTKTLINILRLESEEAKEAIQ